MTAEDRPCLARGRQELDAARLLAGVVSAFGKLVVRAGGVEQSTGRLLRSLFERRNNADYGSVPVPVERAEAAVRDAERFVDAVEAWLATGSG